MNKSGNPGGAVGSNSRDKKDKQVGVWLHRGVMDPYACLHHFCFFGLGE